MFPLSNLHRDTARSKVRLRKNVLWFIAVLIAAFAFVPDLDSGPKLLWQGAHYSGQDRDAAIERGLQFIHRIASNPEYFDRWGHDLLFCFYGVANTSKNPKLRELARKMGRERALAWRHDHPDPPTDDADELYIYVMGAQAAEKFLGPDRRLRYRVQTAANHFSAIDFMGFDAHLEPPPADLPERCPKCNHKNPRGATVCQKCQTALTFRDPYDVWLDALVETYSGDAYGVKLGASYPDALQWISKMRPYPPPADEDALDNVTYAITHVVYTLNDYHKYRLSPAWLPQEFKYLRTNIAEAERYEDPEILGEFMDTLRAFGEDESSPEIRAGMDYLLSHQNPDGSWGEMDDSDIYTRYHTTWTAIDGLREYSYRGERLRLPQMLPLLQGTGSAQSIEGKPKAIN